MGSAFMKIKINLETDKNLNGFRCCSRVEWSNAPNILPNFADARTQQSLNSGQTR